MTTPFAFCYFDGTNLVTSPNLNATATQTRYSWTFTTPTTVGTGTYVGIIDGSGDPAGSISVTHVMLNTGSTAAPFTTPTPTSLPLGATGAILVTNATPTISNPNSPFVRHYLGFMVPESTKLASAHTNTQLFEQFVPFPVPNPTYVGATFDVGFNSTFSTTITGSALPGRGSSTKPHINTSLETWNDGEQEPGVFVSWTTGAASGRFYRPQVSMDTSDLSRIGYLTDLTLDLSAQSQQKVINSFAVDAAGTTLNYPGLFHQPPMIQITVTGGAATSGAASSVTAQSAVIELFQGETEVVGTCSILLIGA